MHIEPTINGKGIIRSKLQSRASQRRRKVLDGESGALEEDSLVSCHKMLHSIQFFDW